MLIKNKLNDAISMRDYFNFKRILSANALFVSKEFMDKALFIEKEFKKTVNPVQEMVYKYFGAGL